MFNNKERINVIVFTILPCKQKGGISKDNNEYKKHVHSSLYVDYIYPIPILNSSNTA